MCRRHPPTEHPTGSYPASPSRYQQTLASRFTANMTVHKPYAPASPRRKALVGDGKTRQGQTEVDSVQVMGVESRDSGPGPAIVKLQVCVSTTRRAS